jgi:tRNA(Ile)-lysidine synthase
MTGETGPAEVAERVLHFLRAQRLVSPGETLVVAVSGGPDSVCLLHILVGLRKKLGISLHAAHLNHRLRGEEAEADARYVATLVKQLDVPATIDSRDVRAHQAEHRLSPEEAAREVRYAFLAQVARSISTERVAVGHTADDHTETILMHLIRGSGTRGLRGLLSSSRWRSPSGASLTVIRPLLAVSREETAGYCQQHGLKPRLDSSNLSLSPLRNRIRRQLMPLLRRYNPQVAEALFRTARIAADDLAFIDQEVAQLWGDIARDMESSVVLDMARFLALPSALQRSLLRAAIEKCLSNLKDIEARHIEEVMAVLRKPAGKSINLPAGLVFAVEYDRYFIGPDPSALSPFPSLEGEADLKVPGQTWLPGWEVDAAIIGREEMEAREGNLIAYFDRDKAGDKLTLRARRPGDRFQPLGMDQPKRLNQFMIDSKIPCPWRQRVPLVCSPEHILWVVGWRIDERAKVTETTRRVLRLEAIRRGVQPIPPATASPPEP